MMKTMNLKITRNVIKRTPKTIQRKNQRVRSKEVNPMVTPRRRTVKTMRVILKVVKLNFKVNL